MPYDSHHLLREVWEPLSRRAPMLTAQLGIGETVTVGAFLRQSLATDFSPHRTADDYLETLYAAAALKSGLRVAAATVHDQRRRPLILTANHHGIDTFADSVQATMLTALAEQRADPSLSTVVVLAASTISLDNPTLPGGFRLYGAETASFDSAVRALRLFPSSGRNVMVMKASSYQKIQVERIEARVLELKNAGEISTYSALVAMHFIEDILKDPLILGAQLFIEQARLVNERLWADAFIAGTPTVTLVYLSLEEIGAKLAAQDLVRSDTILARLLFTPRNLRALTNELNDVPGCWSLSGMRAQRGAPANPALKTGTMFFWGVSNSGRRIPLYMNDDVDSASLFGFDEYGDLISVRLSQAELCDALIGGRLVPSLLTCMIALALERGVTCVGGYYQAAYLPRMRRGVAHVLSQDGGGAEDVEAFLAMHFEPNCVSGLQPVVRVDGDERLCTAGPLDLSFAGGVGVSALNSCLDVPVRLATEVALMELVPDIVPRGEVPSGWSRRLGEALLGSERQLVTTSVAT